MVLKFRRNNYFEFANNLVRKLFGFNKIINSSFNSQFFVKIQSTTKLSNIENQNVLVLFSTYFYNKSIVSFGKKDTRYWYKMYHDTRHKIQLYL